MAAFSLSRAYGRLQPLPSSGSLTHKSTSNPFSMNISPTIANPSKLFHKPLNHPKAIENKFGRPKYNRIGSFDSPHGILGPCNSNISNANISTTSNKVEGNISAGNDQHDDDEKSEVPVNVSWVDLYLPESVRPYALLARLDKPIGIWLFAWPCFWSIALAASPGSLPDFKLLLLFAWESIVFRGANCTVNDFHDRDFDKNVARTKTRPIASGLVTPLQAVAFLVFQVLLDLATFIPLNNYSRVLRAASMFPAFTYPLMKRLTHWPQAYLGITINTGVLIGWAAVKGSLDLSILLPMYISTVFWTLLYDTIYAHQDKKDDLKVGVKSTAVMFGDVTKQWLTGFGIACIGTLAWSGFNANLGWPFYAALIAASGHFAWQIGTADLSSRADCNRKFVSNKWFGAIVFSGIVFGKLIT